MIGDCRRRGGQVGVVVEHGVRFLVLVVGNYFKGLQIARLWLVRTIS
jgi:hypothetical protein